MYNIPPDQSLGFGEKVSIWIEYELGERYNLFSDFGVYFVAKVRYRYSQFGDTSIDKYIRQYEYLNIG